MKIWQLSFDVDKYDNLIPVEKYDAKYYKSFDGRSHLAEWKPMVVERMEPEKDLSLGDAPGFFIPVFSERAWEILKPIISEEIEILELDYKAGKFYGINVTNVLDVIDYNKSQYKTFSDGKKIMAFQKYSFKDTEQLEKCNIFKIVDEPRRRAFVSEDFKKLVEENGLEGFIFKLVWDSSED